MKKALVLGLLAVAIAGICAVQLSQAAAPATQPAASTQPAGETKKYTFENKDSLAAWKITGDVTFDESKNREGKGGSMKVAPKGKAVLKVADKDGSGKVELYVFDDGTKPADPKASRSGPCWGLLQSDGKVLAVGSLYAKYLSGDESCAVGDSADGKNFVRVVQFLGATRAPAGWHKWTFDWEAEKGLKILHNDKDVNTNPAKPRFVWDKISIKSFSSVVICGDAGKGDEQTIWVSDVSVTPGGPVTNPPKGPPPATQPAK